MVALPQTISPTITAIEAAVEAAEQRDFDHVVRGSSIGHPCERHLWYRFRWAHEPEAFDGRKLRLFETGNIEEARMVGWLQDAGVSVQDSDPDTRMQWEVVALDGHLKGHLDGIATGIVEAPVVKHLLECKTHNTNSFTQLKRHGVAVSHPAHVAQMQIYMHLASLTRAFYLAKHKDSDELHAERVHYDVAHALALLAKAERVIQANEPPARISDNPEYYHCRWCVSHPICHERQFALRNCRTCLHSEPISGGNWFCSRHKTALLREQQKSGCPSHLYLPSLVPGEQIDADAVAETVTYQRPDGSSWTDGARIPSPALEVAS